MAAIGFALALLACAAFASSAAADVRVHVSPASGKPKTRFVVRFRAPSATGRFGLIHSHYQLSADGTGAAGCTSSVSVAVGPTRRGQRMRVTLRPSGAGRVWCAGTFRGRVQQIMTATCGPPLSSIACPEIVIAPVTIGRFSFRVKASPGTKRAPRAAGPTFAGLQRATDCGAPATTPKPVVNPPRPVIEPAFRVVQLTWMPATDPATPSAQIVYDIYYSATSGGENFSTPTWVTAPGATSYTVVLRNLGPAYFVVRARDTAGREDHNTVQQQAVNTCAVPVAS